MGPGPSFGAPPPSIGALPIGAPPIGAPLTFVSAFTSIPDHGFWAAGTNRLYVHRGTGVYGFPLRVGVPAEDSVLHVHRAA